MKKKRDCHGLTLIEILITIALISVIYTSVVQIFFGSYQAIMRSDIVSLASRMADNAMIEISNANNPLYKGLDYLDREDLINDLKEGKVLYIDLVNRDIVKINEWETLKEESSDGSKGEKSQELADAAYRVDFFRTIEWNVEKIYPLLIDFRVTVGWDDPKKEFKSDSYVLESQFCD